MQMSTILHKFASKKVPLLLEFSTDFTDFFPPTETAEILRQNCPNKIYAFNRNPGVKFLPFDYDDNLKKINVQSRQECQDLCLAEPDFQCRSATFDHLLSICYLSSLTREMAPNFAATTFDVNFDYFENVCLNGESRCKGGINQFIKEENSELRNADAMAMPIGTTQEQCRKICRDDKGMLPFHCKSFHYSQNAKLCLLSESQGGEKSSLNSTEFSFHQAVCIQDGGEDSILAPNSILKTMAISSSFSDEAQEPFQLLRQSLLEAEPYAVYQGFSLGKCLDNCLYRDAGKKCLSVNFNAVSGECRLSQFDDRVARMVFHPDYNYYRNVEVAARYGNARSRDYYQNYEGAYRPAATPPPADSKSSAVRNGFNFPMMTSAFSPQTSTTLTDFDDKIYSREPSGKNAASRCSDSQGLSLDSFQQVRSRTRLRSDLVQKSAIVASIYECENLCLQETRFRCLSFNYMTKFQASLPANCELSTFKESNFDLTNPNVFENSEDFDFYAREARVSSDPCIDGKLAFSNIFW